MKKTRKRIRNPDFMSQFGVRLRQARISKGVTQQELGRLIGVSFQSIQKYERGENNLTLISLMNLAKALHVDPNYLLGFSGKADPKLVELHTDSIQLAVSMEDLAPPAKGIAMALVRELKKAGFGVDEG